MRAVLERSHAAVRHLLRQPDPGPGARLRHLQAEVRPPRHQPAGAGPHAPARSRSPRTTTASPSTPRSTSATDTPYGRAEVSHVCLNDDVVEGLRLLDRARIQRPVPPRGRRGPARRRVPVRPLRHPDGGPACLSAPTSSPSWSSAPARSSSARPPSSTTPAPRPAGCCKAEGLRVILVNSNPATIMTDPEFADATYVEPITPEYRREDHRQGAPRRAAAHPRRPDRAQRRDRPARGGHPRQVRRRADRRQRRGDPARARTASCSRRSSRPSTPRSATASPPARHLPLHGRRPRGRRRARRLPASSSAPPSPWAAPAPASPTTRTSCAASPAQGLTLSPTTEVLLEESILGWKEYELELMRDKHDNVVVVCSIENFDPMGVHTGDSITVAPAMTLTDREYQALRDIGIAVIREVGVDTGGCNIQFAVNPEDGRVIVIEMNPRVSRSSRAGLQGHRLPDREDRRPAGRRLHAGRDPQRHHREDPGVLRAHARLRRGQGAAVRLREVPGRRRHASPPP